MKREKMERINIYNYFCLICEIKITNGRSRDVSKKIAALKLTIIIINTGSSFPGGRCLLSALKALFHRYPILERTTIRSV